MWRQRQWRDLLVLIDWLPRNSAYMEAISLDEEVAEEMLSQPTDDKKRSYNGPRMSEWSVELEKLTDVVDRLGELMQAVVASAGGKPPKIKPQPRPRTAMDRVKERRRMEHHRKVVSRVLIEQPDGSLRGISLAPPPPRKQAAPVKKIKLQPGENPFSLKAPRRSAAPVDGPITGEPLPPK